MTLVGILAGAVIVAVVAFGQLGNRASGQLDGPGPRVPGLDPGRPGTLGTADAPVTLEVWEDYQCPVCARYALEVEPSIVSEYVIPGRVRIVHHDISILGRTSPETPTNESTIPAKGAYCANEQDLYWPYAHWIYGNQDGENRGGFRTERVTDIAVAAGVEEAAFSACIATPEALTSVLDTTQEATDLTINSTPTFRINGGELVRGLLTDRPAERAPGRRRWRRPRRRPEAAGQRSAAGARTPSAPRRPRRRAARRRASRPRAASPPSTRPRSSPGCRAPAARPRA